MKFTKKTISFGIIILGIIGFAAFARISNQNEHILSHTVNLKEQHIRLYFKNDKGENFRNFQNLKDWLASKSEKLVFAMNGGMFNKDFSPQGLFIENGVVKSPMDTIQNGYGNFYMQPNGVFYITKNDKAGVSKTTDFTYAGIKYATQSGPMLLIDGNRHPKFRKGSKNLNIRNGVGILPDGNIIFAMSKQKINFYDFAGYFKSLGCKNALYLDGFVSKTYLPEKGWHSLDGNFGVIIGETKNPTKKTN